MARGRPREEFGRGQAQRYRRRSQGHRVSANPPSTAALRFDLRRGAMAHGKSFAIG